MATTSIGADRGQDGAGGVALERYVDATFQRDDKAFYFGNDGDAKLEYDEDGNNVLLISGADWRFSDTVQVQFGDVSDVTLTWDAVGLKIAGIPTSNPGAGRIFTSDAGGTQLRIGV